MKNLFTLWLLLLIIVGYQAYAVPYDYSFTHECLIKPLDPQYNGGIIVNSKFDEGLNGWTAYGNAKVEHVKSKYGNKYIVVSKRQQHFHSFSQKIELQKDKLYSFSAWLQVSHDNASLRAIFKTPNGHENVGWVNVQNGCWSMLKGGFVANASGPSYLYFESENLEVDIYADSISLQPFTLEEWQSHYEKSVEETRKKRVKFQVRDQNDQPIQNVAVLIKQRQLYFPFGCAINQNILNNQAYQNWFFSRFKYTVFENELKWYLVENSRGKEDYSKSDALMKLAKSRGVLVRGHNVLWDDPKFQPSWVGGLGKDDLVAAVNKRIDSVVSRYRKQLFHWDVLNENLHFNFFESKLGANTVAGFYQEVKKIDSSTTPFLNEYNTIEDDTDSAASPARYLDKIKEIRGSGYKGPLGIGVQGHFRNTLNLAYIRSALDQLSTANLPIWVTELDVSSGPNQATYLDQVLRELHAHPSVRGIMLWSAWSPGGCYTMCLTDNNFKNLPTGDVVDKFRTRLLEANELSITTDSDGSVEASLFHGEYEVTTDHPNGDKVSTLHKFDVAPDMEVPDVFQLKIQV